MPTRSSLSLIIVSPLECLYLGPDLVLHAQTSNLVWTETTFGLQVGFMLLFSLVTDSLHLFLRTESLIFWLFFLGKANSEELCEMLKVGLELLLVLCTTLSLSIRLHASDGFSLNKSLYWSRCNFHIWSFERAKSTFEITVLFFRIDWIIATRLRFDVRGVGLHTSYLVQLSLLELCGLWPFCLKNRAFFFFEYGAKLWGIYRFLG